MSDLEDFLFSGTNFTPAQIELAQSNYQSRIELLEHLRSAVEASGMTIEEIGTELGWDAETVSKVLTGSRDMSLTDLGQFANTVSAQISFRLAPSVTSEILEEVSYENNVWFLFESQDESSSVLSIERELA